MEFPCCDTCGNHHTELLPRNYRVFISLLSSELPFPNRIDGPELEQVFICNSMLHYRAIRRVIGENVLSPRTKVVVFPSQLVSIFLSNLMDLLQSVKLMVYIANKIVRPQFISDTWLMAALQKYEFRSSKALIGGLFSHHDLMISHEHLMAYDCFKWAMEKKSYRLISNNLQIVSPVLGKDLADNIKRTTHAVLDLLLSPLPLVQPPPLNPACKVLPPGSSKLGLDLNVPLSPVQSSTIPPAAQNSLDGWNAVSATAPPTGWELAWDFVQRSFYPMDE